eukprot:scpid107435/ scgid18201/ 
MESGLPLWASKSSSKQVQKAGNSTSKSAWKKESQQQATKQAWSRRLTGFVLLYSYVMPVEEAMALLLVSTVTDGHNEAASLVLPTVVLTTASRVNVQYVCVVLFGSGSARQPPPHIHP